MDDDVDSMQFGAGREDDDQAGQGQSIKDEEYSERLSNEEELDLSGSKNFFKDNLQKSSQRYLHQQEEDSNDKIEELDFENLQQLSNNEGSGIA